MASQTLKQDMASDFYANVLDTGAFAETVTFYPALGGTARRIVMAVSLGQHPEEGELIDTNTEEIRVLVGRTEAHAKGGIDVPYKDATTADAIRRDDDTETQRFAFTGDILSETPYSLELRFERPKPVRLGARAGR